MRRWELWEDREGSTTFFRADNENARLIVETSGATLVWQTEASSSNAAHSALHKHMKWEPYQPMLREDGTPYPEDEDNASARYS
jgi:hypothetical protein